MVHRVRRMSVVHNAQHAPFSSMFHGAACANRPDLIAPCHTPVAPLSRGIRQEDWSDPAINGGAGAGAGVAGAGTVAGSGCGSRDGAGDGERESGLMAFREW